jgi:hypothetical protein
MVSTKFLDKVFKIIYHENPVIASGSYFVFLDALRPYDFEYKDAL